MPASLRSSPGSCRPLRALRGRGSGSGRVGVVERGSRRRSGSNQVRCRRAYPPGEAAASPRSPSSGQLAAEHGEGLRVADGAARGDAVGEPARQESRDLVEQARPPTSARARASSRCGELLAGGVDRHAGGGRHSTRLSGSEAAYGRPVSVTTSSARTSRRRLPDVDPAGRDRVRLGEAPPERIGAELVGLLLEVARGAPGRSRGSRGRGAPLDVEAGARRRGCGTAPRATMSRDRGAGRVLVGGDDGVSVTSRGRSSGAGCPAARRPAASPCRCPCPR